MSGRELIAAAIKAMDERDYQQIVSPSPLVLSPAEERAFLASGIRMQPYVVLRPIPKP